MPGAVLGEQSDTEGIGLVLSSKQSTIVFDGSWAGVLCV